MWPPWTCYQKSFKRLSSLTTLHLPNVDSTLRLTCICCNSILSLEIRVQKFVTIHYHTPKQRETKFKPSIKLNPNIYIWGSGKCRGILSATTGYICNKATGNYHLYLSKTADLVLVKKHLLTELTKNKKRTI